MVEQVVWCIGNIAGDNWQHRDLLLEKGVMQKICALDRPALARPSPQLLKHLCWTIHNLVPQQAVPPWRLTSLRLYPDGEAAAARERAVTVAAVSSRPGADARHPLDAVLSEREQRRRADAAARGRLPRLRHRPAQVHLRRCPWVVSHPPSALWGIFLWAPSRRRSWCWIGGSFRCCRGCCKYPLEQVRKEACWAASNVAAGSKAQKQRLFDEPGLVDEVMALSEKGNGSVRKEATWVLCNLCEDTVNSPIVDALVNKGLLRVLTSSLLHTSEQIYSVAAAGLQSIFRYHDKYRQSEAGKEADRLIKAELLRCIREVHGEGEGEPSEAVLAPTTYTSQVEEEWNELMMEVRDSGDGDEVERLMTLRNVRRIIAQKDDEEESGLHAGRRGGGKKRRTRTAGRAAAPAPRHPRPRS